MMNQMTMPANNQANDATKTLKYAFMAAVALIIIGCFLPYAESGGESINYVAGDDGQAYNGIWVIIVAISALATAYKGQYVGALISQCISLFLVFDDYSEVKEIMDSYNKLASLYGVDQVLSFGVGFYMIAIGLVASIIIAILLIIKGKNAKAQQVVAPVIPQQQMQPQMMQQPMNQIPQQNYMQPAASNNCPYCGTPKTAGSAFCSNCGAKY